MQTIIQAARRHLGRLGPRRPGTDPAFPGRDSAREAHKQRLRLHRFLLASTFSLLYVAVLLVFHEQGKLDSATLLQAIVVVGTLIFAFYATFQLRLNLRFADPSLTGLQVLAAVFTMLFVMYRAPETRLVFNAFFFVALMFGMLRSTGRRLAMLGTISLAGFGAMIVARYATGADREVLRADLLQLAVTAIAFPWVVFIGSRVRSLTDADRRKDVFLATLAHELRNPLAPIRTGIQILRMTSADARAKTLLPMMERQVQHLTRLLDDLLDVSRITRGKVALQVETIDIRQVVDAAVAASRPLIEQMQHELAIDVPAGAIMLPADPVRLTQVVSNLLNNAAKFTPRGGHIALRVRQAGDQIEVSVADDGIGIPAGRFESIFEMFTQIEGAVADVHSGLGIGLGLVKGLVALHGGTIEVHSAGVGRGSEFRVQLPMRGTVGGASVTAPAAGAHGVAQKILVVDDNRDAAASLRMLLELMGHDVRVAHGGDEGVRVAADFRPHAILLDLGMPDVDGYEACRRIRATAWGGDIRMIAVTGWGQDEDRRKSTAAGFEAHLVKPVRPDALARLLDDTRTPA
jgi:signal transduction histidine kinase/CheY-like chemotaxis protein